MIGHHLHSDKHPATDSLDDGSFHVRSKMYIFKICFFDMESFFSHSLDIFALSNRGDDVFS